MSKKVKHLEHHHYLTDVNIFDIETILNVSVPNFIEHYRLYDLMLSPMKLFINKTHISYLEYISSRHIYGSSPNTGIKKDDLYFYKNIYEYFCEKTQKNYRYELIKDYNISHYIVLQMLFKEKINGFDVIENKIYLGTKKQIRTRKLYNMYKCEENNKHFVDKLYND